MVRGLSGLGLVLILAGCGKQETVEFKKETDENLPTEAIAVRKAFESAEPALKNPVMETMNLIKAGAYAEALPQLEKLAGNPVIDPGQKQALETLITRLKTGPPTPSRN